MLMPPSTARTWPVMNEASALAKNATAAALTSPESHKTAGKYNWKNPVKRDKSFAVRGSTIEDIIMLPSIEKLRILTLGGQDLIYQQILLDDGDIGPNVEEIICLEADKKAVGAATKRVAVLRPEWKKKITLVHASSPHILEQAGKATGEAPLSKGFDLIWLDMVKESENGSDGTLSFLIENLQMFQRAWRKGNPGLLYLNLMCSKDGEVDRDAKYLACADAVLDRAIYRNSGQRVYRVTTELESLLNRVLKRKSVIATPLHTRCYTKNNGVEMLIQSAGFHIEPISEE